MTVVKFCGLRTSEETAGAIEAGCDLIGLNFVKTSPRFIEPDAAKEIVLQYHHRTQFVGVFMDSNTAAVESAVDEIHLSFLQFSGSESDEFCHQFGVPYIKVFHVSDNFDFEQYKMRFPNAWAYMLDTASSLGGGSGKTFDWNQFPKSNQSKLFLAGGLRPENVGEAINKTQPWGVDVASGIETRGHMKHRDKMIHFMQAVRDAQR